jgi:hypothetical protein
MRRRPHASKIAKVGYKTGDGKTISPGEQERSGESYEEGKDEEVNGASYWPRQSTFCAQRSYSMFNFSSTFNLVQLVLGVLADMADFFWRSPTSHGCQHPSSWTSAALNRLDPNCAYVKSRQKPGCYIAHGTRLWPKCRHGDVNTETMFDQITIVRVPRSPTCHSVKSSDPDMHMD